MLIKVYQDLPASDPNSREELSKRLAVDLKAFTGQNPVHSISHCPLASGYVIADAASVGFDIEVAARIHRALVERISTPEELQIAPDFRALWVAKESAFKALNKRHHLTVMSEARITAWKVESEKHKFSVTLPSGQLIDGEGTFQFQGGLILGIFCEGP